MTTNSRIKEFFSNPEVTGFRISPNGEWLSYRKPHQSRLNVFIRPARGGSEERLTDVSLRDIPMHSWKGNDTILLAQDSAGDENFHIFAVDVKTKTMKDLTPFPEVQASLIDDLEDIDEDHVLIAMNKDNPELSDVYRVHVRTGEFMKVASNPGGVVGWVTDHRGAVRLAVAKDGVDSVLYHRHSDAEAFQEILRTSFKENIEPVVFNKDNNMVYALSNRDRDKVAVVELDPTNGKHLKVLFEHEKVDVSSLSYSKAKHRLQAAIYTDWKTERYFFDTELEKTIKALEARIPNKLISILSSDKEENTFTLLAHSDLSRGEFFLYDLRTDELRSLGKVSPSFDESKLSPMKPISYKSFDGLEISGYLTIPRTSNGKNLPVIVNPHGGPWYRDQWGYNPEVQFLASLGYAVFQPNFRGSTGFGRKFWEASFKEWGKAMQDDVTAGVKWLISEGIADQDRIAIYGGSYGGYCTLAGITFTPDLYRCAVDYVGVSNLFTFIESIPPYWKPFLEMLYQMVGHPETDREQLMASSPLFHIDKIKCPLFVAQGAKDPRVKQAESDQIVDALKEKGIDVQYLLKENEGHGFQNEENRFEFYGAMEKFFNEHL